MKEFFKIRSKKANRARIQVITIAVSLMLVAAIAIGGTVAWLIDTTDSVENTFTYGKVDIELNHVGGSEYKIIPGEVHDLTATVSVNADSEACYIFVKPEYDKWDCSVSSTNYTYSDFIMPIINDTNWKKLDGNADVYYYTTGTEITACAAGTETLSIVNDTAVTINTNVTADMITALQNENGTEKPTIRFTAYAIQSDNLGDADTPAEIWNLISPNP